MPRRASAFLTRSTGGTFPLAEPVYRARNILLGWIIQWEDMDEGNVAKNKDRSASLVSVLVVVKYAMKMIWSLRVLYP